MKHSRETLLTLINRSLSKTGWHVKDLGTQETPEHLRYFHERADGHDWHPVPDLKAFAVECGAIGS